MPRYIRNAVLTAKIETTAGTDAVPTGAANAILFSDASVTPLDAQNIDRNNIRGYFGASEQLVGTASVKLNFSVELAGSGTAGTAPAFDALLQACALASAALLTPSRNEYTPVSSALKTATIYYYDDGVLHKLLGAMGTVSLSLKAGEIPKLNFEFTGLDGGVATGTATGTYTAFKTPVPMTKANVVDITLGATYAAGALTGGTVYPSTGMEIQLGNAVAFTALLSSERIDITDRAVSGSMQLDLTAAQEVSFMTTVKANTTQSVAITVGTVAGNKFIVHAPAVQLTNPKKEELNGTRLIGFDLRFVPTPTGTGNDELRLAFI
jgi:Phage tail tube protein